MPTCPYPTHQGGGPTINDELPISFCKEDCLRTFFCCPKCGEANRPLARFCRRCSTAISFEQVETDYDAPLHNGGVEVGRCNLSALGVKEVNSLNCFRAHLILDGDASIVIFDIHKPHEPLAVFVSPDGRAMRGSTPVSSSDEPQLLVTTAKGLYLFSLLSLRANGEALYKVSEPDSFIYHRAFECAGDTYWLEHEPAGAVSRLVRLPHHTVATFPKFSSVPLVLAGARILLATADRVLLYDPQDESVLEERLPEPLVEEAQPAYIEELNMVYLTGQTHFWRGEANKDSLSFAPLNLEAIGDPRIAAKGTELFVARSQGIFVSDPFGSIKWDSRHNFIAAPSDGRAPRIFKDYFAFTSPGPLGGSNVRLHRLDNPKEFELVPFNKRLRCSPVLSMGHLCAAIGDEHSLELVVK